MFQLLYRGRNRGFWHQQDLRSPDKTAHFGYLDKDPQSPYFIHRQCILLNRLRHRPQQN
jgi:hypothetical protein